MDRLIVELAGIIDEVETVCGELEEKSFSKILTEWIKSKVSGELDRVVDDSEIIMALLVLSAKRNIIEFEENLYSGLKSFFEVLKRIDVFRF